MNPSGLDGSTYRPLTAADAPAILQIELAVQQAERAEAFTDLAEVTERMTQPGVDLAGGSVAAIRGDTMVGCGYLYHPGPGATWTAWVTLGVHPDVRRQGTGSALLDRLLGQAKARQGAEQPSGPGELKIGVSHGRVSMARFATAKGFQVRRYFFDMQADLASVDPVPPPPGIRVRTWTAAGDEATRLAYNQAFADHWGSVPATMERWRGDFAESPFFRPEFSRVGVSDGEVVGFVLVEEYESETAAHGYRTGYLALVGTVRSMRGRGLAAAMMTDSMAALAAAGCRYAELGVDADSPTGAGQLYERLGFRVQRRNEVFGLDF